MKLGKTYKNLDPIFPFNYWKCICGYIISDEDFRLLRYDFPCHRCGTLHSIGMHYHRGFKEEE